MNQKKKSKITRQRLILMVSPILAFIVSIITILPYTDNLFSSENIVFIIYLSIIYAITIAITWGILGYFYDTFKGLLSSDRTVRSKSLKIISIALGIALVVGTALLYVMFLVDSGAGGQGAGTVYALMFVWTLPLSAIMGAIMGYIVYLLLRKRIIGDEPV